MQASPGTTPRGRATFAGWCPSATRCCSLRSKLRLPGSYSQHLRADRGGSPFDPQKHANPLSGLQPAQRPGIAECWWRLVVVCVVVTAVVDSRRDRRCCPSSPIWLGGGCIYWASLVLWLWRSVTQYHVQGRAVTCGDVEDAPCEVCSEGWGRCGGQPLNVSHPAQSERGTFWFPDSSNSSRTMDM